MKFFRAIGSGLTLAALAACSGGTGASVAPSPKSPTAISSPSSSGSPSAKTAMVRVKSVIHIPRSKANTSAKKKRAYVSPSTEGLIIQVNQNGNESSVTGYDLTTNSASSTCTVDQTGNDCTIYLNAPVTNSNSSDEFFIYSYDSPEPSSITNDNQVAGHLLSEDIGSTGNGDPVPSSTNTGISATGTNTLVFTLSPVVENPQPSITVTGNGGTGTFFTGANFVSNQLVISVPGTGGTSNVLTINGYDADGNEIQRFVSPSGADTNYVDPIFVQIYGGSNFTFDGTNMTTQLNNTSQNTVQVVYTPAPNDAPNSVTATATYAQIDPLLSPSDFYQGGYDGTTVYPFAGGSGAIVAPLYSYIPTTATPISSSDAKTRKNFKYETSHRKSMDTSSAGLTNTIYAMQYLPPTLPNEQNYYYGSQYVTYSLTQTLTDSANNDCSEYTIDGPNPFTYNDSSSVQASWTVTVSGTFPNPNSTCTLTMSDGISSIPVVLTQNDVANTINTTITTPQSQAQPLMPENGEVYSRTNSNAGLLYPSPNESATIGDTLVCIESYEGYGQVIAPSEGSTGNFLYFNLPETANESGMFVALYDVTNSTDELTSSPSNTITDQNTAGAPIFCGEYQNTSAAAIGQGIGLSKDSQLKPTNSTVTAPGARPQEIGESAIVALASGDPTATYSETGYTMETLPGEFYSGDNAGLYVQSLSQVDQNTNILKPVITTSDPNEVFEGITLLIPLGPSAHAQFNMAKGRTAVTHAR